MSRSYDPLSQIPKAKTVRTCLQETERKAAKLRVLLRIAEEVEAEHTSEQTQHKRQEVTHA